MWMYSTLTEQMSSSKETFSTPQWVGIRGKVFAMHGGQTIDFSRSPSAIADSALSHGEQTEGAHCAWKGSRQKLQIT